MSAFFMGGLYMEGDLSYGDIECQKRPTIDHQYIDGEWVFDAAAEKGKRINDLQSAYEIDRDRLNKAWLSALIADGANEAARQAVIKSQMEELDVQLEADILAIIMEE